MYRVGANRLGGSGGMPSEVISGAFSDHITCALLIRHLGSWQELSSLQTTCSCS